MLTSLTYNTVTRHAAGKTPQNFKKEIVSVPIIVFMTLSFIALIKFCIPNIQNISNVIKRNFGTSHLYIGQMYSGILLIFDEIDWDPGVLLVCKLFSETSVMILI